MKTIILVLLALTSAWCAWEEILTKDCNGDLYFLNRNPLTSITFNFTQYHIILDYLVTEYKNFISCECPTLSDDDYRKFFVPWTPNYLFQYFSGEEWKEPSSCDFSKLNFSPRVGPRFNFPHSCNASNWERFGECLIQMDFEDAYGMKIGFAMKECSNSYFPFISVVCDGIGCSNFLKPCNSDSDCGSGYNCVFDSSEKHPTDSEFLSFLSKLHVYGGSSNGTNSSNLDENDISGCIEPSTLANNFYNFLSKQIFNGPSISPALTAFKFCIPQVYASQEGGELIFSANGTRSVYQNVGCNMNFSSDNQQQICSDCPPICRNDSCFNYQLNSYEDCVICNNDTTCCYNNFNLSGSSVDCSTLLKSWDSRENSFDVFDPTRLNGKHFPTIPIPSLIADDDGIIFSSDCLGNFNFIPEGSYKFSFNIEGLPIALKFFMDQIRLVENCRIDQLNDSIFNILYGIEGVLYYLTTPTPTLNIPDIDSWGNILLNRVRGKLHMPETCTYEYFTTHKYCALEYIGLQDILNIDVTLHIKISKCPNSPYLSIYLGCKGTDCFVLDGRSKLCSSDSDCTSSTSCVDITQIYSNYNLTNPFDVPYLKDGVYDPLLFMHVLNDDKCYNSSIDPWIIYRNGLRLSERLPLDNSRTNTLNLCFIDMNVINRPTSNWTDIMNDQVMVVGDTIMLKGLNSWQVVSSSNVYMVLFALLVFVLLI